jgi:hypothetical protein
VSVQFPSVSDPTNVSGGGERIEKVLAVAKEKMERSLSFSSSYDCAAVTTSENRYVKLQLFHPSECWTASSASFPSSSRLQEPAVAAEAWLHDHTMTH